MKTFSILLLACMFVPYFSSCIVQRPVEQVVAENNKDYKVDYLFEHEGCKVYRFIDGGHSVYFTNCTGDVTSIKNDSTKARVTTIVKSANQ